MAIDFEKIESVVSEKIKARYPEENENPHAELLRVHEMSSLQVALECIKEYERQRREPPQL